MNDNVAQAAVRVDSGLVDFRNRVGKLERRPMVLSLNGKLVTSKVFEPRDAIPCDESVEFDQ